MKGALGNIVKQAQKMQEAVDKAQQRLANEEVTGESGGGLVKLTLNGRHQARKAEIDPSLFQDDRELLEDLIVAAINDAAAKIEAKSRDLMSGVTGGLGLPPGFKLPF
ncbi:nucleoid-associated protein [Achromatium sp. WMS2]|nr:nucleoid-associated protein [Achromatium sp. WMS2]